MSFERIYTHITKHCPHLAPKNTWAIHEWLASGYDPEKDIIPSVDEAIKRGANSIYSFGFFTHAIQRHHAKRIQQNTIDKATEKPSDEMRAKAIAFKTRKLGQCIPHEERWLRRYEEVHGQVTA